MTSATLNLILSILIPTGAGYALITLLFRKHVLPISIKIALSYGLGFGILSIWMLGLYIFQRPFTLFILRAPLFIIIAYSFLSHLITRKSSTLKEKIRIIETQKDPPTYGLEKALQIIFAATLLTYIGQNIILVCQSSMTNPISTWDAIATVAFKAKIFYFETLPPKIGLLPHRTYPLFTPFAESWIAFNLGRWDDLLIKIIFPCAFLSYLVIHYKFLSHFTNRTWALLGCVILLSSNLFIYHATISYRDFFLMYFNCITIMLLLLWNENKATPLLVLASLFAGFATFTKLEGTAFLGIYLILFSLINFASKGVALKEKLYNTAKFCIPSISILAAFHIYKIGNNVLQEGVGIVNKTKFDLTWNKISLIPQVITRIAENLLLSGNWSIVWLVALLSLLHLEKKRKNTEARLIFLTLMLFFGLYVAVAVLTINYIWIAGAESNTTLSRLILHFFPLSVLLIILFNYPEELRERKNTSSLNPK